MSAIDGGATTADSRSKRSGPIEGTAVGPSAGYVWAELAKASFAIISWVTASGDPRSSGVVCGFVERHLYFVTAPDSHKARRIMDGQAVAVTVCVRRGGLLSLLMSIPPATISFHARAIVHPAGSFELKAVSTKLEALVPKGRRDGLLVELVPEDSFLTYGIGVSMKAMLDPVAALRHVPVA